MGALMEILKTGLGLAGIVSFARLLDLGLHIHCGGRNRPSDGRKIVTSFLWGIITIYSAVVLPGPFGPLSWGLVAIGALAAAVWVVSPWWQTIFKRAKT